MPQSVESPSRIAFGLYEADLQTGELWKAGHRIKLQSQPFKVLAILVERPGEVVSREELQDRLWGKNTTVDFDHSLGTAINKVREALSDSADNPRYIETLARRGYRFIAPVTALATAPAANETSAISIGNQVDGGETAVRTGNADASAFAVVPWWRSRAVVPAALAGVVAGGAIVFFASRESRNPEPVRITQLTHNGRISPGSPTMEGLPSSATDGVRIFTGMIENGRTILAQVFVNSGDAVPMPVPSEIAAPALGDLSPDGSKLLLRSHLSAESEQPLWVVPTAGGSALRVANVIAHDATWMPDGNGILYAAGSKLFVTHMQDGASTEFATLPYGRAFWLRWSPDGKLLRFTVIDPITHTQSLWELSPGSKSPRPLLAGWSKPEVECCGTWTADGKYYVFQSSHDGNPDLWRLNGRTPLKVTNGPLSFEAPEAAPSGHRIYFLGLDSRSELYRFNAPSHEFLRTRDFLSDASRVDYSRDGKWVAWTDPQGRLWRARVDGSEKIQLTADAVQVFLARWSPDGERLALMAREPGQAWQLYMVKVDGSGLEKLLSEKRNAADPSWSADGQRIVFGRVPDLMGKEDEPRNLQVLDLATRKIDGVPESNGYFSPRWSPDGRYIAAITLDQRKLVLFDTTTGEWKTIYAGSIADPVWAPDGRSIYIHAFMAETQPIDRVWVSDGRVEEVASLAGFRTEDTVDYFFSGITPDNVPLVRARSATGNLYSLNLDGK
jgi:Tol biopolymer transport system component/DNA-binding winged helix-turn-helix (wHTH) protein